MQAALLSVFDSQISGGKHYDLASMGHRRANATYFDSHGMDLSPLIQNAGKDVNAFVQEFIQRFAENVKSRLARFA